VEPDGLAPLRAYLERFWRLNLVAFAQYADQQQADQQQADQQTGRPAE